MSNSDVRHKTLTTTYGEHGQAPTPGTEDVVVLVHLSSTHSVPSIDPDTSLETLNSGADEYPYSRLSSPTRNALKHWLVTLEGADHALAFVSGTAAIVATMTAVVRPGGHIAAFESLYGRTETMLTRLFADRLNVGVSFVGATSPKNVAAVMHKETALVWMEAPTNPLMYLCDIEAIAVIVNEDDAVFGVNNTFLSPQFQTPLSPGAGVVAHNTTKYLNGRSDSIGGAVVIDCEDVLEELAFLQHIGMGSMLSPFDSYLMLWGVKTLPLRIHQHETNTMGIVEFLDSHEMITRVLHSGLESHPRYDLAARQQSGFGDVLSFELDTDLDGIAELLGALWEFPSVVSLGGVGSLIGHPATMTHSPPSQTGRDALGISDSLLQLSVGVKRVDDLRSDLASVLSTLWGIRGLHSRTSSSWAFNQDA